MAYSRRSYLGAAAAPAVGAASSNAVPAGTTDPSTVLNVTAFTLDTSSYVKSQKESAMKSAAASMGMSVGIDAVMSILAVIPVIGWAVDALLAVIGLYSSWYDKRKIAEIQGNLANSISSTAATWTAKYAAQVNTIYQAEATNAYNEIAADRAAGGDGSGGPTVPIMPTKTLAGLGSFMSNIGQTLAKGFAQVATAPVQYAGTAALRAAQGVAKLTGNTTFSNKMGNDANEWTAEAQKGQAALTHDITHGQDLISHIGDAARMVTGEQQVFDARRQADSLLTTFTAKLQAQYNLQLGQISDPVYRAHLRAVLKGMMIADPNLYAQIGGQVAQAKATTLMLAAGGAAAVGWFLFRR